MKLRWGITFKLTLLFTLFAAVLLVSAGLLAYFSQRQQILNSLTAELETASIEKQAALDSWVADREADVEAKAASPAMITAAAELLQAAPGSAQAQDAYRRLRAELQARVGPGQPYLSWLVLDPQDGRVMADTAGSEEGKFREDRPFFIYGRQGPYVQNVYNSASLHAPAMTISAPLQDESGRLVAVLAARLDLEGLNAIIQRRTRHRQSDDAFLVNTSSLFVTQPRLKQTPAILSQGIHTEGVQRCLLGESDTVLAPSYRGIPAIINFAWLPTHNMCLVVKVDQAEAFAPITNLTRTAVLGGGLALLTAFLAAAVLARTFTRPLLALQQGAARFGRGELDTRLPETGGDEISALAHDFNRMAGLLQTLIESLEERVAERTADLEQANLNLKNTLIDLERSNRDLEQFAYVASHDLQEPLRMVASFTQLLARRYQDQLDAEANEFIAFAVDGARRMQQLINDLLAYSRVGTRGKPPQPTDCNALLGRVRLYLSQAIMEKGAIITNTELPTVMADEGQLGQVFQNLIGNAIKFCDAGKLPYVHISAVPITSDTPLPPTASVMTLNNDWLFSVRDNGPGIEPQYFERIFVIFQRLHSKEEYPGTGIGLALCKKIIERHGGRIWVESNMGQGTTFFFTLPVVSNDTEEFLQGEN